MFKQQLLDGVDIRLIDVNDGGVYRLTTTLEDPTSQTAIWQSLCSNLCTFEIHSLAYDSVNNYVIVGTQDNGTIVSNQNVSKNIFGGDGGDVQCGKIENEDKTIIYSSSQNGGGLIWLEINNFTNLETFNFYNVSYGYLNSELSGNMSFVPHTAINIYNPKLIVGSAFTDNISINKIISHNIDTGLDTVLLSQQLSQSPFYPRKLLYGHPSDNNAVFVLTVTGKYAIIKDSGYSIFDTNPNPSERFNLNTNVIGFDLDPTDMYKVYIIEGQRFNESNLAENDILICDLSQDGPDIINTERVPINYPGSRCIKYYNNKLYVGCSRGVYIYDLTLKTWSELYNETLPNCIIYDMILNNNTLFISTFGRGVFSINL